MSRIPLSKWGISLRFPAGHLRDEAIDLRKQVASAGNDTEWHVSPLTLRDLRAAYSQINAKYSTNLQAKKRDLADLKFALARSAGAYLKRREGIRIQRIIAELEQLVGAIGLIYEAESLLKPGLVDTQKW